MAGKNQVTLTFAGDSTKLSQTFDEVGSSARKMDTEVGTASRGVGTSFDTVGEAADGAEGKAQGFSDTLTGTKDIMGGTAEIAKGNLFEGFVQVGQGAADLAGGLASFMIPALKNGVTWIKSTTIAQKALNLAMRLNPIGLVITAITLLVAGFILAYKKSATFRSIVQGAMKGVQVAFGWVVTAGQKLFGFFQKIGPSVAGALKGVASTITAPFRLAFDGIRNLWNSTIGGKGFSFPGFDPPGPGSLPGFSFTIPRFHTGGIVPGGMGSETLALLRAGERVTAGSNQPAGQQELPPIVLEAHIDLGDGVTKVVQVEMRRKNRELKRDVKAA